MSIHDMVIANQNGANTRSDLNNALAAIVSNNSSATEPTTTYAYQWWCDTGNDLLKQRNAADSAWISILTLSTGAVSNAAIADDSITLAKMAGGTDGELITYDTAGDPTTVPTGSSGEVLTSNGAGTTPTFQTAAGGGISYTDAWHLFLGASVTITGTTTLDFTNNVFIGSNVSESGGAITVTDAGLYLISCGVSRDNNTTNVDLHLYIGSTVISGTRFWIDSTAGNYAGKSGSWVVRLSASDVISVKGVGHFYGALTTGAMTFFSGVRLGD